MHIARAHTSTGRGTADIGFYTDAALLITALYIFLA